MGVVKPQVIQEFYGGQAQDLKLGPSHSFGYSRHLEFRKSPTSLTMLPATTKETGSTVVDLITDMVQLPSGLIVSIGDAGGVYTRSTSAVWAKNGTTLPNTAMGLAYVLQQDTIYIPGTANMHSITNADGRFGGSFTVNASTFPAAIDQQATGHANTYTTTGSITETAANKLIYNPTMEPLYSCKLWVTAKGNTNIVITLHDSANNVLGTVTLLAAAITNGAQNEFVFATPVRLQIGATYHFHVTHSAGTASTIGSGTAADFSTAEYATYCNFFVNGNNHMHPVEDFLQYLVFGNERYLSVWEPISQTTPLGTEYQRHRIIFPSGFEVTSMANWNEYKAIAVERRSTNATSVYQEGKIFFWDGISTTYTFVVDTPEGAPYGLFSQKNVLYWFAGGSWWAWSGGNPVKLFQMPNSDNDFSDSNQYIVNYPHTQSVRNSILLGGFPSETNSQTIEHAIYSYGTRDKGLPESFGYGWTPSHGQRTNGGGTLRIGCVKTFGDKTFVSWRNGTNYGVDIIDPNSNPFDTGTFESLILDDGRPDKTKQANELIISFDDLPDGCTVTPKYKIDRGSWVQGDQAVAGDTEARFNINKRYKEIQVGFEVVATISTPTIVAVTLMRDTLSEEAD